MKTKIKYALVIVDDADLFQQEVQDQLDIGYELQGGVSVSSSVINHPEHGKVYRIIYSQALIKEIPCPKESKPTISSAK